MLGKGGFPGPASEGGFADLLFTLETGSHRVSQGSLELSVILLSTTSGWYSITSLLEQGLTLPPRPLPPSRCLNCSFLNQERE